MMDIVDRLRGWDDASRKNSSSWETEAADEIDRLRAEVAILKEEKLELFATGVERLAQLGDLTQQLAAANGKVEVAAFALVKAANMIESDPAVTDTIWYSMSETLWDFMIRTAQEVMNGAAAIRKSEG
jgi:hypothetical protein